jgi:tight adherence protein B
VVNAIILGAFVLTLVLVFGPYWLLVVRQEERAGTALRRRLFGRRGKSIQEKARAAVEKQAQRMSAVPLLDRILRRRQGELDPVTLLIEQSGTSMTVGTFLLASGLCGLVVALVAHRIAGLLPVTALLGLLACTVPTSVLRFMRTRRLLRFEEQFPEALDLMSRALKAGHAFTTGLAMVAEEIPTPIGPEFKLLYEHQNFGMPVPDALAAFAQRIPLLDARFFVTAVLIQRQAGGNLSEVLDNLASVIRDRFKVKRQIRVISAHGRLSGLVLASVPPALAFVLFLINPDHFRTLVNSPLGIRLIMLAVILQITGSLIIRKLIQIEY